LLYIKLYLLFFKASRSCKYRGLSLCYNSYCACTPIIFLEKTYPTILHMWNTKTFKLFGFQFSRLWTYLMQVIPETSRAHYIVYLHFYCLWISEDNTKKMGKNSGNISILFGHTLCIVVVIASQYVHIFIRNQTKP
jgi:hypothetical protein